MYVSRALAGAVNRIALALALPLALSRCGDSTEPGTADPAGVWSASITNVIRLTPTGQPRPGPTCTAAWTMTIKPEGTSLYYTVTPFTAIMQCGGETGPWERRGQLYDIRQDGPRLVFMDGPSDTFLVATLAGGNITGLIGERYYPGATFRATRSSSTTDPNLAPARVRMGSRYPDVELGDSLQFTALVEDAYGSQLNDKVVTWSSSAPAIASIDAAGFAHGLTPGLTTVNGTVDGVKDSATITVLTLAASVTFTSVPDSMIEPGVYPLPAIAKDGAGQPLPERRLTWSSSDPSVATADQGYVSTLAPGGVTITVRSTTASASVTIPVLPGVAQITIGSAGTTIPIGSTLQLTATTRDKNGNVLTGRPVSWSPGDGPLPVDQTGLVRATSAGAAQVSVSAETVTESLDLVSKMDAPLTSLAAGDAHTCGLGASGHVYCWGQGIVGQLGPANSASNATAVLLTSPEHFTAIATRNLHTCALNQGGAAFCWGYNSFGQLGQPTGTLGAVEQVSGGLTFAQIAAGFEFTCGVTAGGSAHCWGSNGMGQLGLGTNDLAAHTAPASVVGGHAFTVVAAGDLTACGLTAAGEAWCWGSNQFGNLGLGTQDANPHPVPVHAAPGLTFTAIAPGSSQTCGITAGGQVFCWGESQLTPAALDATTGYVKIAAGRGNFCRLDGAGAISCWGHFIPGSLPGEPVLDLSLGSNHVCAKPSTGKVICWGSNTSGQLGDLVPTDGPIEVLGQP